MLHRPNVFPHKRRVLHLSIPEETVAYTILILQHRSLTRRQQRKDLIPTCHILQYRLSRLERDFLSFPIFFRRN